MGPSGGQEDTPSTERKVLLARHDSTWDYVKKCFRCVTSKPPTPTARPTKRHLMAFQPQEVLAVDFVKLDKGHRGYEDVLVLTDALASTRKLFHV